jgi:hypothetical protein
MIYNYQYFLKFIQLMEYLLYNIFYNGLTIPLFKYFNFMHNLKIYFTNGIFYTYNISWFYINILYNKLLRFYI